MNKYEYTYSICVILMTFLMHWFNARIIKLKYRTTGNNT